MILIGVIVIGYYKLNEKEKEIKFQKIQLKVEEYEKNRFDPVIKHIYDNRFCINCKYGGYFNSTKNEYGDLVFGEVDNKCLKYNESISLLRLKTSQMYNPAIYCDEFELSNAPQYHNSDNNTIRIKYIEDDYFSIIYKENENKIKFIFKELFLNRKNKGEEINNSELIDIIIEAIRCNKIIFGYKDYAQGELLKWNNLKGKLVKHKSDKELVNGRIIRVYKFQGAKWDEKADIEELSEFNIDQYEGEKVGNIYAEIEFESKDKLNNRNLKINVNFLEVSYTINNINNIKEFSIFYNRINRYFLEEMYKWVREVYLLT